MGLPRLLRLTRKYQFDRVLKERMVQLRNGPFRAYAAANLDRGSRLGLIIGKRHARRAVDRNRIKRALRESFREGHDQLEGFDIVVQLIDSAHSAGLREHSDTLWPLLHKAVGKAHDNTTAA